MKEITSVSNSIVKNIHGLHQKKGRTESGMFLIEGLKGVLDAIKFGIEVESIFVLALSSIDLFQFPEESLYLVNEAVMKKISTTDTPPEIVAVAHQQQIKLEDIFEAENPLIVVIENIKDPGNLGTIVRTAKACNVSGIILTDNTVDIYNPKTVRASVGNLWKLPIVNLADKENLKAEICQIKQCQFLATVVGEEQAQELFFNIDYKKPTVIMFGSEAEGLSDVLTEQADFFVNIPMNKDVESLNLSVSVGVILYESLRQRLFG